MDSVSDVNQTCLNIMELPLSRTNWKCNSTLHIFPIGVALFKCLHDTKRLILKL